VDTDIVYFDRRLVKNSSKRLRNAIWTVMIINGAGRAKGDVTALPPPFDHESSTPFAVLWLRTATTRFVAYVFFIVLRDVLR
jgi:hypothetical protein